MIYILRKTPTPEQVVEMLEMHGDFIKLAVDIRRRILAGGGKMHADCERLLLVDGSQQRDIWGGDWYPVDREVAFVSLINIRPSDGNSKNRIQDPELREIFERIAREIFEGK